jgi:hypothetical protein
VEFNAEEYLRKSLEARKRIELEDEVRAKVEHKLTAMKFGEGFLTFDNDVYRKQKRGKWLCLQRGIVDLQFVVNTVMRDVLKPHANRYSEDTIILVNKMKEFCKLLPDDQKGEIE